MRQSLLAAALVAATVGSAHAAESSPDARLAALEARLAALEQSSVALKQQASAAEAALAEAQAELARLREQADASAMAAAPATESSPNAFNPAISLVLNGTYASHSVQADAAPRTGFYQGDGGINGLNLGESELTFSANVDDKFYGQVTLAAETDDGADHVGVEEAFIDTTALPAGLTLRAGRFFSNIGYLNSHHAHTDKFADRPLVYQVLLGGQYGDDGLQLRWVAPTTVFLELGGELLRGERYPFGGSGDGLGVRSLFAHIGGDLGVENSWQFGLSGLRSSARLSPFDFEGHDRLLVADATWKWAPQGNFRDGGLTLRSEYVRERLSGHFNDPPSSGQWPYSMAREGAYVEAIYRLNRQWEAGFRVDRLWGYDATGVDSEVFSPLRHSLMLSWLNSEFSLLRLQLDEDRRDAEHTDHVITLQYQTSLGAHGAHKF